MLVAKWLWTQGAHLRALAGLLSLRGRWTYPALAHSGRFRRGLRCLRGFYVLSDLPGHFNLVRVMTHMNIIGLVQRHPLILFKYLHVNYLACCFGRKQRLAILTSHYSYIKEFFPENFLPRLFDEGKLMWQQFVGADVFSIFLAFPRDGHDFEGEMRLDFKIGSTSIYTMTATLVEGRIVQTDGTQAILITVIQGGANRFALIKHATKCLFDTSPAYLLLAAIQGLASALNVRSIVGVGNEQQLSRVNASREGISFDYDRFWECLGAGKGSHGLYLLPVPIPERPIHMLKRNHRGRTLRRRELKRSISESVAFNLRMEIANAMDANTLQP